MPVVEVWVAPEHVELAADALWAAGASAVSEEAGLATEVRLVADVQALGRVPSRWRARPVSTDLARDLDGWREFARAHRVGRVVLSPAWHPDPPDASLDDVVVRLDPGHAFGSGSHPSTRLALALLQERGVDGAAVLDVGCGSGVLSVAACLLGADHATALDIDRQAVEATEANAAANGVAAGVSASTTALAEVSGSFDLVVANIGARVLRQLASAIDARLAPGGAVVLAGLLEHQLDEVLVAFAAPVTSQRVEEGWVAVTLG